MHVRLQGTPIRLTLIRTLYKVESPEGKSEQIITENAQQEIDSVGYIHNETGRIIQIADTWLIEQNKGGEIKRYVPDYLPDAFKTENTEITFSAIIRSVPQHAKMMGIPVTIKELMMIESVPFREQEIQEPLKDLFPVDSVGYLKPVSAVVKKMGSDPDVFILEVQETNNSVTRYLPFILPDEFKVDGATVIVSGTIGRIPPNVRLMGTPFTIDAIVAEE
jgi:hypothetical protein